MNVLANDLLFAVAEKALGGRIESFDSAPGVDDDDAVDRGFDDRPPAQLAHSQCALRLLLRGDVPGDRCGADGLSIGIADRRYRERDIDEPTVFGPADGLIVVHSLTGPDARQQLVELARTIVGEEQRD